MAFPHNCRGTPCYATLFWWFPMPKRMEPKLQEENTLWWILFRFSQCASSLRTFIHSVTHRCFNKISTYIVVKIYKSLLHGCPVFSISYIEGLLLLLWLFCRRRDCSSNNFHVSKFAFSLLPPSAFRQEYQILKLVEKTISNFLYK
jgi:hypothetical protein